MTTSTFHGLEVESSRGVVNLIYFSLPNRFALRPGGAARPREHPADHAGDPQRGGGGRDHHQLGGHQELSVHGAAGQHGLVAHPVPQAERRDRAALRQPALPGPGRADKAQPPAQAVLAAENQNPRPDGCEHHRPLVTDHLPFGVLHVQPHLLALLRLIGLCC